MSVEPAVTLLQRLTAVAAALGEGWVAVPGTATRADECGYLAGPDSLRIRVFTDGWTRAAAGRIFLRGTFGGGLDEHAYGLNNPRISVAAGRPPAAIAGELTRRLVTSYRHAHTAATVRKVPSDAADA